ncbi:lipocalin family protein [Flavobacterium sp.]|uniref:lipocalin family protein n=1 Tax=Flavobacterium sp. TaxID=239 RepID=UPI0026243E6F|nr:lipocalin family protein [Flavobacterium sp.]MDG2431350.1 hypothetical protein [Flavobacterium sp.]
MKTSFKILFISLLFVACKQKIEPADIAKINGYWEIEKVVFDKGDDKDYSMNETYDYFEIKNNKGFRKKVMPQLDGTFLVNDTQEALAVRFVDDKVFLDYKTPFMKWSEEIIALTDAELVVVNADKKEYHYKKTEAINLLGDGEKNK